MKQRFEVTGMTCSACSAHVEKNVRKVPGVTDVAVNLLQNNMSVTYDEKSVQPSSIIQAVKDAGYGAYIRGEDGQKEKKEDPAKLHAAEMKKRLIWSLIFMVPLLYLAMGNMLGAPLPDILAGSRRVMVNALTQLLLVVPIAFLNRHYFTGGFRALINRAPNMDSLIAVGSSAAIVYSTYMLFRIAIALGVGQMHVVHELSMDLYYESAGVILTLITLGKFLEARSKGKTSEAIEKLLSLAPKTAVVLRDGLEVEVVIEEVAVGDTIVVRTGQSIPVDGEVIDGRGAVNESALTGESMLVDKEKGDKVIGSTINASGYFTFRATKVGADTTFAQIIRLVEEAGASKAPIAKLADKVSGVFVPVVMGIALISAIVWLMSVATVGFAISIGIAVLVISCPCALGLATPTAIMVGTGKGAELGILIKSAESLEIAHTVKTVVLDKTGTITEGKPQVTDVVALEKNKESEMIGLAASAEKLSEHPLAQAIVEYAQSRGMALIEAKDLESYAGAGIACRIGEKSVRVGNAAMMDRFGIHHAMEDMAKALSEQGKTVLYIADGDKALGLIAVADVVKPTSRAAVLAMERMGMEVYMLTGDNERTAKAVAEQAGISHVIAQVLPQEKEMQVRRLQQKGKKVAMIGDGVNDAPALVRADVGIAIGAGTDVAIESADVVLIKSDLMDAVRAFALSKATIRNIKQNLFWAFFYNVIGIPIAAGVLFPAFGIKLNPMFAAAAMSMSSVFVVTNALRLKMFDPKRSLNRGGDANRSNKPVEVITVKAEAASACDTTCPVFTEDWVMKVSGMTCEHCKRTVEKALLGVAGVVSAAVDLQSGTAQITAQEDIAPQTLKNAVEAVEYKVDAIRLKAEQADEKWTMQVVGMTCEHCVNRVKKALLKVEGVKSADVNLQTGLAIIEASPNAVAESMQKAVEAEEYEVKSLIRGA